MTDKWCLMTTRKRDITMPRRPRALDLFCCAGGMAMGLHRAGFDVIGVDLNPQPNYPFRFHRGDALAMLDSVIIRQARGEANAFLGRIDYVHASPPCQAYSDLKTKVEAGAYPKLIEPVRELLIASGLPYTIENVCGAPLINPIVLCGTMFPGLRVLRHRLFESNVPLVAPPHPAGHPLVFTHDKRKAHYGALDQNTSFVQVTGGGNCTMDNARDAMGIDWPMTKRELNEAIPPAYGEFIGRQVLRHIEADYQQPDYVQANAR